MNKDENRALLRMKTGPCWEWNPRNRILKSASQLRWILNPPEKTYLSTYVVMFLPYCDEFFKIKNLPVFCQVWMWELSGMISCCKFANLKAFIILNSVCLFVCLSDHNSATPGLTCLKFWWRNSREPREWS